MPHEILGYDRDDVAGVFLSVQLLNNLNEQVNKNAKAASKQSKGQSQRRARMNSKRPGFV